MIIFLFEYFYAELKFIKEQDYPLFLAMVGDRNMISHAYSQEVTQGIYEAIRQYYELLKMYINQVQL